MFNAIKNEMNVEHSGAVAFEYIIILVIMAVVCFFAWNALGNTVRSKATDISNFIAANGQNAMGTNGASSAGTNAGLGGK